MEADLLLSMFDKEFKKMHLDLCEKEVRLFHHMFHHIFATRFSKIEQYLQNQFKNYDDFEPDYEPISSPSAVEKDSHKKRRKRKRKSASIITTDVKQETIEDFEGFDYEDDEVPVAVSISEYAQNDQEFQVDDSSSEDSDSSSDEIKKKSRKSRSRSSETNTLTPKNVGRKRNPIWECYTTIFGKDGKVTINECRKCGQHISPKATRMQLHLLHCKGRENDDSFKLPMAVDVVLKRFKAKMDKQDSNGSENTSIAKIEERRKNANESKKADNNNPIIRQSQSTSMTHFQEQGNYSVAS